jgi:hypothetical protein
MWRQEEDRRVGSLYFSEAPMPCVRGFIGLKKVILSWVESFQTGSLQTYAVMRVGSLRLVKQ